MTEHELFTAKQWLEIKNIRNSLLRETDWTQVNDHPFSEQESLLIKDYRAALRNIPQEFNSPESVVWPQKPDVLKAS
ncbi:tail fiber assembly protein [Pseudoalteromonas luteoviolacea]|uniref:Phage tail assembly chaperone-like domain-containing protein n=1 Tax=Pseudoalteromonas luteoviolacea H33 TaxID=1365251 RepID=A0A167E9U4_9GAMM|nr:tail fiber assembly protein [Pseudoalteromonas luteoviolacea]KZN50270.1 hypothetical protein N476_16675 [Pseudoalteromonas luteoviolacea H33]KZN76786.1 hypothetical protein N477_14365 [Pseudoalteromonas luteoviolacea H33-S]MBQ4878936.1 phage tail assembly chaperone [Pseudoalteromonas luteoviolacea]MBQ4907887.1 phage tail assembly chaperone [Pseudoalteromonas luteoviolacea]